MKTLILTVLFSIVVLPVAGQEDSVIPVHYSEAKLVVSDLINGSYLLGYERGLGKHIGVSIGVGYKTKEGLVRLSGLKSELITTDDLTYSGTRIIPEFRYYLQERSSGMLTGFYFGAYITFMNYKSDLKGIYSNENGDFDFLYDARINTNSVGLMVGYKLPVTKRFNIDFLIAGPGAGFYTARLREVIPAPDEFWIDLNDVLEAYSLIDLVNADFDFTPSKNNNSLLLPSFRYGITLGYSF